MHFYNAYTVMPSENIMEVKQIVHISNIKVLLKLSSHIFSTAPASGR